MLSDTPTALPAEPVETTAEAAPPIAQWGEMALTVMFTLAAVLFVSFLAVVTGLVCPDFDRLASSSALMKSCLAAP
jgi:hypothetical protein